MAPETKHHSTRKSQKANQNHRSGSSTTSAKPTTTTDNTSGGNTTHASTAHHQTTTVDHQQQQQQRNNHNQQYIPFKRPWAQDIYSYNHTTTVKKDATSPMERWQSEDVREQAWHAMDGVYLNDEQCIDVGDELQGDGGDVDSMVCAASFETRDA